MRSHHHRPFRYILVALLLGLSAAWSGGPAFGQASATVFEGARLIDGTGGPAIENAVIVVSNGRITAIGPAGQVTAPAGASRLSLAGKTVMPALVDAHVHTSTVRDDLVNQLRAKAYFGVSAVLSMGLDNTDAAFTVRTEVIPGAARLRTAGRGITAPEPGRSEAPFWITSADEGRQAVQELAAKKVDVVKIWVDDRDGKFKKLTPELYSAVIDEAHKHKLRVAAHIFSLEDAKGLLKAGVDIFAHGVRDRDIDDEFIALVKARPNVVLIPNMPDRGVPGDPAWLNGSIPAGELQKLQANTKPRPEAQKTWAIQGRNLARLSAAGMKVAMGTDGFSPWSQHVEMEDMVAAGMTAAQVIVAATRVSAETLLLSDTGTLQTGKRADFLVLDANPLENITNTRRISAVYLNGQAVDRDAVRARLSSGEAR
jgi:imidazolonepropionase-like amidohydrolase